MLNVDDIALDASNPTPLYRQLAEGLRALINDGSVRVGEAVPSERELSTLTQISRVTVRKAIDTLLREGMLSRRRGSGTYVAPRIEQPASVLAGFTADMSNRDARPGSIWIDKERIQASLATAAEARLLSLPVGAAIVRIERRTFLVGGAPVEFTRSADRGDRYGFVTEVLDPGARAGEDHNR
ncbi:MAG: GntR family transcriptional regulator [Pseudomonadota bacterium]